MGIFLEAKADYRYNVTIKKLERHIMNLKTLKPIKETKYLSVENAWRYRVIMRTFYIYDQKFRHWLTKEDIFEELRMKESFEDYTIDLCKQDLEALNQWGNLNAVQDTSKVTTYQQFVNKQYRYQMTEYAIEIERMTVRLENMHIEGGSLEPTLLERIKDEFKELQTMLNEDDQTLGGWWNQLTSDFQRLNQNYQDYIRDWYSAKVEELMKTKSFLVYKEKLVDYLRHFIKELQQHAYEIEQLLKKVSETDQERLWQRICDYEMDIPRIDMEAITREDIFENNKGKYISFKQFFLGSANRESEVEMILSMTNEIIRRITRYAANILEMTSQYSNRKEEYMKMANLFLKAEGIEEAHILSAHIFGISGYKHFTGDLIRETDSIYSSIFEEAPLNMIIAPRIRSYRDKILKNSIIDHSKEKEAMREKVLQERIDETNILMSYLKTGRVAFEEIENVPPKVRRTLLRWLTKGIQEKGELATTEHGKKFRLINPHEIQRCKVKCDDGVIEMPAYILEFED